MKLYYCGFNGYQQCPKREQVVKEFSLISEGVLKVEANYRTIILQYQNHFEFFDDTGRKIIELKLKPECFAMNDDVFICGHGLEVSVYDFCKSDWNLVIFKEPLGKSCGTILKIIFVADFGFVLLCSNGSVWSFPNVTLDCELELIYPPDLDSATDISSGFEHVLILTESGCLLAFGGGRHGQLGFGDLDPAPQPQQLPTFDGLKVTSISAGGWHSCALTDSRDLYVWGWNCKGQLGQGGELGVVAEPRVLDLDFGVVAVACGSRHTVILSDAGEVYATGWNKYNQLGLSTTSKHVETFTKVTDKTSFEECVQITCGPWSTMLLCEDSSAPHTGHDTS